MAVEQAVKNCTHQLRFGDDPFWARLREQFQERGFDVSRMAYIDGWPEDNTLEVGTILTCDSDAGPSVRAFYFEFYWPSFDALEQGVIREWQELPLEYVQHSEPRRFAVGWAILVSGDESASGN